MSERTGYASGAFCWTDLGTTDAEAAKEFYRRAGGSGDLRLRLPFWSVPPAGHALDLCRADLRVCVDDW